MSDVSKTTINLPSDLKKELKKIAIDEETSLSGLILQIIKEGYEARTNNVIEDFVEEEESPVIEDNSDKEEFY